MNGIDISAFQPNVDWSAVKQSSKVEFVYSKATEGTGYVASTFKDHHDGAKKQGIPFGAYHFFKFGVSPEAQAAFFLTNTDGYRGTLVPMVDIEGDSGAFVAAELSTYLSVVEQAIGHKVVIYTGLSYWNEQAQGTDGFAGHPLWVAEYNSASAPELPKGFTDWYMWQYTDAYFVPGIGPVDGDRTKGALLTL